jgi:hypothetical protein
VSNPIVNLKKKNWTKYEQELKEYHVSFKNNSKCHYCVGFVLLYIFLFNSNFKRRTNLFVFLFLTDSMCYHILLKKARRQLQKIEVQDPYTLSQK